MESDMTVTLASAPAALAAIGSMALKVANVCATGQPANIEEELHVILGIMPQGSSAPHDAAAMPQEARGDDNHPCESCGKIVGECGQKPNSATWCNAYEPQERPLPAI